MASRWVGNRNGSSHTKTLLFHAPSGHFSALNCWSMLCFMRPSLHVTSLGPHHNLIRIIRIGKSRNPKPFEPTSTHHAQIQAIQPAKCHRMRQPASHKPSSSNSRAQASWPCLRAKADGRWASYHRSQLSKGPQKIGVLLWAGCEMAYTIASNSPRFQVWTWTTKCWLRLSLLLHVMLEKSTPKKYIDDVSNLT